MKGMGCAHQLQLFTRGGPLDASPCGLAQWLAHKRYLLDGWMEGGREGGRDEWMDMNE